MADSESRKRALEILANPHAKESDWIGALAILDGKLPVAPSKTVIKMRRFLKRVALLSVLYSIIVYAWSELVVGPGVFTLPYILSSSIAYATLEATCGFFTISALWIIITTLMNFGLPYPTTLLVLGLNIFVYASGNWRPYILVPINKFIESQPKLRLLSSKSN